MALNTYADLIAGMQEWVEDDDTEFQNSINDIVNLAEIQLARDLDLALFRRTDSTTNLVVGTATVTKPTIASPDLLVATKGLYLTGGTGPLGGPVFLENRSAEYVLSHNYGAVTGAPPNGVPRYYSELDESQWVLSPAPDDTYVLNLRYLSRPQGLGPSNQTNWFADNCWDILFLLCLVKSEKFLKSDDRIAVWKTEYQENMPRIRAELYNQFGNQYDTLGATPTPQLRRSFNP